MKQVKQMISFYIIKSQKERSNFPHDCNTTQNARKTTQYVSQASFQVGVEIGAEIIYLQESYIGAESLIHPAYEFRLSKIGELRQQQFTVDIKMDIAERIIVESRSDIIDHPYIQVMDVQELDSIKKKKKRTRTANLYDNGVRENLIWHGNRAEKNRSFQDVDWRLIIKGRMILVGDFNAHSKY